MLNFKGKIIATGIIIKETESKTTANPKDIAAIILTEDETGCRNTFAVKGLYSYLKKNPNTRIYVGNTEGYLAPTIASNGEHYLRTCSNPGTFDVLMDLPRETFNHQ